MDQGDQMLEYYSCLRKTVKCYCRVLFHKVEVAIHNAFVNECGERERTERGGRCALDFRIELSESLIGGVCKECLASIGPCNECPKLQDVGHHVLNMLSTKGNRAVCKKKIRKAYKDQHLNMSQSRIPPVPYVPHPSIFCQVCNVYLCLQKGCNCWSDFRTKVECWR